MDIASTGDLPFLARRAMTSVFHDTLENDSSTLEDRPTAPSADRSALVDCMNEPRDVGCRPSLTSAERLLIAPNE